MRRQRLGIMGGTFDPIHNGHLMIARAAMEALHLDRVLFIPDRIPPHKAAGSTPAGDRLAMVILAIADEPRFLPSDMELRRKGPSYTYDTVRALYRRLHAIYDLFFIIGGDSAEALPTWYRIRETMRYCTFAAVGRPGYAAQREKVVQRLAARGLKRFIWVNADEMDISSTMIRQRLKEGKSVDSWMPKSVVEYIRQRDLYRR
jgi:nicotinate-nucleotide adenylyltransferase